MITTSPTDPAPRRPMFAKGPAKAPAEAPAASPIPPWFVLVVDDDPEVHVVTRFVLSRMSYKTAPIEMISAYSAEECLAILAKPNSIAVILLDVVMETDDAGLQCVRRIRDDLGNSIVRIILRTGQPGQAPEERVIVDYDINDYKAKTELTAQKLFTSIVSALRSYEHIMQLETSRRGLDMVIESSSSLFRMRSLEKFNSGILLQIQAMLGIGFNGIVCVKRARTSEQKDHDTLMVVAGSGRFEAAANQEAQAVLPPDLMDQIRKTFNGHNNIFDPKWTTLHVQTSDSFELVIALDGNSTVGGMGQKMLEVFVDKLSVGFENICLFDRLNTANMAAIVILAQLAEHRDTDTGEHVLRVATLVDGIARHLHETGVYADELDETLVEMIGLSSILHDVGKVGVPDKILLKPGRLEPDEADTMRDHANQGRSILESGAKLIDVRTHLSLAAEIAGSHHERWDGIGYPRGLKGRDTPIAGRIVAVADVYDALLSDRPYKPAWSQDQALAYIRDNAGTHFDPEIVNAFLAVIDNPARTDLAHDHPIEVLKRMLKSAPALQSTDA